MKRKNQKGKEQWLPADQRRRELEEIAEDFSYVLPEKIDARVRMICVLEILRRYTSKDSGLTAKDVSEVIRMAGGPSFAEATIRSDIQALADSDFREYRVSIPARGTNEGFRYLGATLSNAEVRLIANMVDTCKFISDKDHNLLKEKLLSMGDQLQTDEIAAEVYSGSTARPKSANAFLAADEASLALRHGCKLRFQYCRQNLKDAEALSVNTEAEEEGDSWFVETPLSLVYTFDNYYLVTYADAAKRPEYALRFRRLDRVRSAQAQKDTPAYTGEEVDRALAKIPSLVDECFDMMMTGDVREIFLQVKDAQAGMLFNRFGRDIKIEHVQEDPDRPGANIGFVRVRVQVSSNFYRWLFGARDGISLAPPKSAMWCRAGSWKKLPSANTGIEQLRADYEAVKAGYADMLRRALEGLE